MAGAVSAAPARSARAGSNKTYESWWIVDFRVVVLRLLSMARLVQGAPAFLSDGSSRRVNSTRKPPATLLAFRESPGKPTAAAGHVFCSHRCRTNVPDALDYLVIAKCAKRTVAIQPFNSARGIERVDVLDRVVAALVAMTVQESTDVRTTRTRNRFARNRGVTDFVSSTDRKPIGTDRTADPGRRGTDGPVRGS